MRAFVQQRIMAMMKAEADALVASYGRPRRSVIAADSVAEVLNDDDLIPDEKMLIVFSDKGYIKSLKDKTFVTQVRPLKQSQPMRT